MPFFTNRGIIPLSVGGGGGTVLFDTSALGFLNTSTGGTVGWTTAALNVGSGSNGTTNLALVVAVMFSGAAAGTSTSPTATWNGVSMGSAIGGPYVTSSVGDIYFFGKTAPATGANSLVLSWTGSNQAVVAALSVVGANQTGGSTTFHDAVSNPTVGTNPTVTVSGAIAGEISMGAFLGTGNYSTAVSTDISHDNGSNFYACAAAYSSGAAPVLAYNGNSGTHIAAGVAIKAA